jgi:3'-phosphoadenosine 5'-phosphosulfate sulfotransferase (PAPS reductase)/FAD synthetase
MEHLLKQSKEIYDKAVADFKPMATVMMFSGGDDSLTTYHVARELDIKFDFVIHGNTRTGIPETTEFARKTTLDLKDRYLEADAGDSYLKYLNRKGFFGIGIGGHAISYHLLKQDHFERVVSANIRQRKRNFPIMFINGMRRDESENRRKRLISPYKITPRRKNDMWCSLILNWSKSDCKEYLCGNSIERNPVSINLCRSGECMCGTMQSKGDRVEAAYFYPTWGKWLTDLETKIKAKHGFGWGESIGKRPDPNQLDLFQPMCVGCTKNSNF